MKRNDKNSIFLKFGITHLYLRKINHHLKWAPVPKLIVGLEYPLKDHIAQFLDD